MGSSASAGAAVPTAATAARPRPSAWRLSVRNASAGRPNLERRICSPSCAAIRTDARAGACTAGPTRSADEPQRRVRAAIIRKRSRSVGVCARQQEMRCGAVECNRI
eukprot:scaffold19825_cov103-Isochrysis_galbana.AAC.2